MTDARSEFAAELSRAGRKGRGRWIWALLLAAALTGGGYFYLGASSTGTEVTYLTEPVAKGTLTVTVTATGTVQPTTEIDLSSELSGTLAAVEADFNDVVEVGQVLARLDDTKLRAQITNAQAQKTAAGARVTQAGATLREAEATFATQRELREKGIGTQRDLLSAEASLDRARAALDIARADLTLAEANLELQQADLDKAVIRSPIKGIVLDRNAEAGQIVASSLNAPVLFTLAEDLARMELVVNIDEADIGRVAVGNGATFSVDAFQGQTFPAEITEVRYAPETTDGVVTYKAVLTVDNSTGQLRPGMTATTAITVATVADTLMVPNAALRYAPPQISAASRSSGGGLIGLIMPRRPSGTVTSGRSSGRALWVLRDGVPVELPALPGESDGKLTAVQAEGLAEGDLVITDQRSGG